MSSQDSQSMTRFDVPWYQPTLQEGRIPSVTYELLENYSRIPSSDIEAHVTKIREKAWSICPYPCIGLWSFLDLSISLQPAYDKVLSLLKEDGHGNGCENGIDNVHRQPKKLLDLGCCFAQDIRKLIYDGAPANSLYGCDLKPEFFDLGYELFADRESCKAHFIAADVLCTETDDEGHESELTKLAGEIDFVYAAAFFHIFSWDDQVRIAKKVVQLLKPEKGSLVFGRQTGNVRGQEVKSGPANVGNALVWRHDLESFKKLWEVVGEATGSKWEVLAELYNVPLKGQHWVEEGIRMLRFEVTRLG